MEKITSTDGTVISYYRSGSGPPLLLVHGTTANHQRWASVSPRLQQHFTVYTMDRRGRGESGDSPDYNIMREAEDVAAIADAIGEPVSILGHSYGAVCSLEASLLTNNIQKLILYEPPIPTGLALYPPDTPGRMQVLIDKGESEAALEVFFREIVKMPDHELESYRQLPMWKGRISLAPTIPREMVIDRSYQFDPVKFRELKIPVLLLLGGDSPPLFRQATDAVDSALPGSRVAIMPGQQHIAMDIDPELFLAEVLNFLQE